MQPVSNSSSHIEQTDVKSTSKLGQISQLNTLMKISGEIVNKPIKKSETEITTAQDKVLKHLSKGMDIIASSIKLPNMVLYKLCKGALNSILKTDDKSNNLKNVNKSPEDMEKIEDLKFQLGTVTSERSITETQWNGSLAKSNVSLTEKENFKNTFQALCKEYNRLNNEIALLSVDGAKREEVAKSQEQIANPEFGQLFNEIRSVAGINNPKYVKLAVLLDESTSASIAQLKSELLRLGNQ